MSSQEPASRPEGPTPALPPTRDEILTHVSNMVVELAMRLAIETSRAAPRAVSDAEVEAACEEWHGKKNWDRNSQSLTDNGLRADMRRVLEAFQRARHGEGTPNA